MRTEIIGEVGINHNGDVELAKRIMRIAERSGIRTVKFQKRNPDVCVPEDQKQKIKNTPWGEMSYIDYKKRIEFGLGEYLEIIDEAHRLNIDIYASVWDIDSAVFCYNLGFDKVKIPSACITNIDLLLYCCNKFGFRLMSTGMSTEKEIDIAVRTLNPQVIYHCCAAYPAKVEDLNLARIPYMISKYPGRIIGYSGHEVGLSTTMASVAIGARFIERHITSDRTLWGSDQAASVGPVGQEKLVRAIGDIDKAIGVGSNRVVYKCEQEKLASLRQK